MNSTGPIQRKKFQDGWKQAATLVKDYLAALWSFPCSDCWEENEDGLHTYTLAAVYAGLSSYAELFSDSEAQMTTDLIRTFLMNNCVQDGCFTKSVGNTEVDSNLLGLVYPYKLVSWDDPIFQKTLDRVRADLATPVGLHRYRADTYYGGGEWILLTTWLGCVYAQAGDLKSAQSVMSWIEGQATGEGNLAEQAAHGLYNKRAHARWVKKWGEIASPLLWSHANYILLMDAILDYQDNE